MDHHAHYSLFTKARYYLTVGVVYLGTISGLWFVVQASGVPTQTPVSAAPVVASIKAPEKPKFVLISGKPVRIVIPDSGIDLPVTDGYYNEADGSWTLSGDHAQFAMVSFLANNASGSTFIYGHGTDTVFGRLGAQTPAVGSVAKLYTDNGHVFVYSFDSTRNLTPDDTSVLAYTGPAILTIQTCTGSFSEWRSMFQFHFEGVES